MSDAAVAEAGLETDAARRGFTRASAVNVTGNAAKILVEAAAGLAFGSVALLADAAHSVGDLVASGVVLVWGRSVYSDPDDTHPHGHQRVEPLAALFVGPSKSPRADSYSRSRPRRTMTVPTNSAASGSTRWWPWGWVSSGSA